MNNTIFKTGTIITGIVTVLVIYFLHLTGMPCKQIFLLLFFITAMIVYLGVALFTRPDPVPEEELVFGVSTDWEILKPDYVEKFADGRFVMYVGTQKQCEAYIKVFKPKG